MNPVRATLWAFNFLLVGAIAYAAAVTTALVLERNLPVERAEQAPAAAPVRPVERARKPLTAFQGVMEKNIFHADRTREPVARPARAEAPAPPQPEGPLFEVTLTGTFLAGEQSFAMISVPGSSGEQVYRVGECLPRIEGKSGTRCSTEQGRLVAVAWDRITVVKDHKRSEFKIREGPQRPVPVAARPVPSPMPPPTVGERATPLRGRHPGAQPQQAEEDEPQNTPPRAAVGTYPMTRSGNTFEFTVPNAEVEQAFANFTTLMRQARVVPLMVDGQPQGFEIRKIQPGSIFQKLGLQDNDLIRSVNGQSLTDADQALRLFTVFRNEREIVLDVERDEQPVQLSYTIQ